MKQQAHTPVQFGVSTRESSKDGFNLDVSVVGLNVGTSCVDQRPATLAETWTAVRKANAHDDMLAALEEALEFVEGQVDVVDGDYGQPAPNKAMNLFGVLRAAIAKATA